jgi:hypothetical protein
MLQLKVSEGPVLVYRVWLDIPVVIVQSPTTAQVVETKAAEPEQLAMPVTAALAQTAVVVVQGPAAVVVAELLLRRAEPEQAAEVV